MNAMKTKILNPDEKALPWNKRVILRCQSSKNITCVSENICLVRRWCNIGPMLQTLGQCFTLACRRPYHGKSAAIGIVLQEGRVHGFHS